MPTALCLRFSPLVAANYCSERALATGFGVPMPEQSNASKGLMIGRGQIDGTKVVHYFEISKFLAIFFREIFFFASAPQKQAAPN
jgi:hypothetical protein